MIYAVAGSNSFAMKRRLDEIVSEFIEDHGELAVERFDGEKVELQAVLDAVQALPFLAKRKLVVVRNGSANKDLTDNIEQIISSISDGTDLVFYEPLTDKRTAFYKTLKSKTEFEEFRDLDTRNLARWLVDEARKQKTSLSLADATYMVQRVGQDQQLLASEFEKLVTYNPKISRQNIDLLTEPTPQSKIFDLLDAAFGDDKQKALEIYEDQRQQRVEPAAILAMLAWQLNILALCKLGGDKQPAQIAKDAGLSPFPVIKASALAKKMSDSKLKQLVSDALEIDYKSKTVDLDLDEALKTYIATM